ncbi:hypothetical protein GCM10017643_12160 [Ancylobacter dichloromethanicus]|uniref:Uncharacterized protein n=1 Tax=Ancylobacter dichloromethanicus TaxID=518825 RepID=A0A9W6J5C3_9HYPH|nr:hypothetical protein GCM10017643_12160 [Ancylobacter dichloromethanicus]
MLSVPAPDIAVSSLHRHWGRVVHIAAPGALAKPAGRAAPERLHIRSTAYQMPAAIGGEAPPGRRFRRKLARYLLSLCGPARYHPRIPASARADTRRDPSDNDFRAR